MHSESSWRRRARTEGLSLVKFPEWSRWYGSHGPYALRDQSNTLVAFGMDAQAVERELYQA